MKRIVRLTESDLVRLVKNIIEEQSQGQPLIYSLVVDAPNKDKSLLYNKIKEWLVETYNNFSKVVQLDDKENGLILLKGAMKFSPPSGLGNLCFEGWVNYTLKIQIKDNRFKIELKDMEHEKSNPRAVSSCELGLITDRENYTDKGFAKTAYNKPWNKIKTDTKLYFDNLTQKLTKTINSGVVDDFKP